MRVQPTEGSGGREPSASRAFRRVLISLFEAALVLFAFAPVLLAAFAGAVKGAADAVAGAVRSAGSAGAVDVVVGAADAVAGAVAALPDALPLALSRAMLVPVTACALCAALSLLPRAARRIAYPALTLAAGAAGWFALGDAAALATAQAAGGVPLASHLLFALLCALMPALLFLPFDRVLPAVGVCGAVLYTVCGFLARTADYAWTGAPLGTMALVYAALLLLHVNRARVRAECELHEKRPSRRLAAGNAALTVGVCLLMAAAAYWRALAEWASAALNAVAGAVGAFFAWLGSLFVTEEVGGTAQGDGGGGFPALEVTEPSLFAQIMERVVSALAVLLVLAALVWLAPRAWRLLRRAARRLAGWIGAYFHAAPQDYTDETEALTDAGEHRVSLRARVRRAVRRAFSREDWERMDNRQRVRRVYGLLASRAKTPIPAEKTARQVLLTDANVRGADRGALADSYDAARYGERPISDAEAENARRAL